VPIRVLIPVCLILAAAAGACFGEQAAVPPAPLPAKVAVDADRPLGAISPLIYGQYVEHVRHEEECVYRSIWDDRSPLADAQGLRKDTVAAVKEMGPTVIRWPGGNYADNYHWEDGIGPRDRRPVRKNPDWGGTESHQFGTDEFVRFCRLVGAAPYVNVNLGTGSLPECLRWIEYCNGTADTPQGRRRQANGIEAPYGVTYWGIGNENWGAWEAGHMDAAAYARKLKTWATAVREVQPEARILAVGSAAGEDPTWDRAVLDQAAELIDFLTFHQYAISKDRTSGAEFEAAVFTPACIEDQLRAMLRIIDEFAARRRGRTPIAIAVDEWNVRHVTPKGLDRRDPRTLQDALFTAGMLNAFIRLSPRVGMANHVFLVNGNAPLLVDANGVVKTPQFHVFRQYARWMQGKALTTVVDGPSVVPPAPRVSIQARQYRPRATPYLDASAALRGDGALAVAMVNRHPVKPIRIDLVLPAGYLVRTVWTLDHADIYAVNNAAQPDRVTPSTRTSAGDRTVSCPPHALCMVLCTK
jgi:alpha-N-arabinofuranosidase